MGNTEPKTIVTLIIAVVLSIIAGILTGAIEGGWNLIGYLMMAIVGFVVLLVVDLLDAEVDRPWINSIMLGFILVALIKIVDVLMSWLLDALGL